MRLVPPLGALVLALLLVSGEAHGQTEVETDLTETISINTNQWRAYRLVLGATFLGSDSVRISVAVTAGGLIDVYTTTAEQYENNYTNPSATQFSFFEEGSRENVSAFGATFSAPGSGTYYVVIDNAPVSNSGAPGSAPVTVRVTLGKLPFPFVLVVGVLVGIFAALAVVIVLLVSGHRRKTRAVATPEPPREPPSGSADEPPTEPGRPP